MSREKFYSELGRFYKEVSQHDYYYLNDTNNSFVDKGLPREAIVEGLAGRIKVRLPGFNALMLIHPDYLGINKMQIYKDVMQDVLAHCGNTSYPVFTMRYQEEDNPGHLGTQFLRSTHIIPSELTSNRNQDLVNYIRQQLGTGTAHTRLAFGGMLTNWCVREFRDRMCQYVYPDMKIRLEAVENPFSFGEVLSEASVDSPF